MNELTKREKLLLAMTAHELPAIAVKNEIAIHNQIKIPISRVTALGTGLQPMLAAIQQVTANGQAVSGYYKVTIPAGTQLAQFKDGTGFLGTALDSKGIAGQARLNPMMFNPTMLFVAATLANIDKKLDAIQETQKEMMEFLAQKEKSVLRGNLDFLNDVYNNYKHNWNSEKYKSANLVKVLDIRQNASQMIDFYREQIKRHLGKQSFLHSNHDVKKQSDLVKEDFKEYQLALYIYGFAYFMEILLQENYDSAYLEAVEKKVEELSFQYRELYTKVYTIIEMYAKTSLQSKAFKGLSMANRTVGETIAKIPIISKAQIDEKLIDAGRKIGSHSERKVAATLQQLVDKQSSCVRPFVENIAMINLLYNQPLSLVFNNEHMYIGTTNVEGKV